MNVMKRQFVGGVVLIALRCVCAGKASYGGRSCWVAKHPIVSRFGENIRLSSYVANPLNTSQH